MGRLAKQTSNAFTPQPFEKALEKSVGFYNVPDSAASDLVMETLGAGADIADLPARKKKVNHSSSLEVLQDGKRRQVTLSNPKGNITLELSDIDKLTGSNKPAKKLFVLSMILANEQAIHGGQLTRDYISFPLQELIDIGFYGTPQSARKGFNAGMNALTSLKVKGHIQQTKKKSSSVDVLEVLFTGARIDKGQCTVYLNPRINWGFMTQYFTILPRYYFKLPNRASDLLYYIFYIARQRTRDIEERGYFTISFRAIQQRLQLPSEIGNGNPYRTIKQPIDEAIEALEAEHLNLYGNDEFSLLPVVDDEASISEYLDRGYLKVSLKGGFAQTFIQISKDTAKQIATAEKRRERIADTAIAINQAKALKAAEDTASQTH